MPSPTSWCHRLLAGWIFPVLLCAPLTLGCGGGEPEPKNPEAVKRERQKLKEQIRRESSGK